LPPQCLLADELGDGWRAAQVEGRGRSAHLTDSLAAGQPARLMGYPVAIDEAMPDIGSNTFPVGFGDFSRGYGIFDLGGLRITIDDNITTPGLVKYYFRKRVGGCVLNNNAVRFIKCAA